jgi:hypothetical protein
MALDYGTKPTSYSDTLTGLSLTIYTNRINEGIYSATAISTTVGSLTFTETTSQYQTRLLNQKLLSWIDAKSIIDEFKTNGELIYGTGALTAGATVVTTVTPSMGTIF